MCCWWPWLGSFVLLACEEIWGFEAIVTLGSPVWYSNGDADADRSCGDGDGLAARSVSVLLVPMYR